jgi:hypothetical protein
MAYIHSALEKLNLSGYDLIGEPTTAEEFLQAYKKHTGVNNGVIVSSSVTSFDEIGVTWEDIVAKIQEVEEAAPLNALRTARDKLLKSTDWVAGEDVPQSLKDIWYPYRQALRDITNTYTSLENVVWPVKPE